MSLIHLEKENFKDLIKEKVLVDFYAEWCGPCKMLGPVLEELSKEINIIKIDVDKHEELAMEYKVMSVPTLIIFENEKELKREIGFRSKDDILDMMR